MGTGEGKISQMSLSGGEKSDVGPAFEERWGAVS